MPPVLLLKSSATAICCNAFCIARQNLCLPLVLLLKSSATAVCHNTFCNAQQNVRLPPVLLLKPSATAACCNPGEVLPLPCARRKAFCCRVCRNARPAARQPPIDFRNRLPPIRLSSPAPSGIWPYDHCSAIQPNAMLAAEQFTNVAQMRHKKI